MLKTFVPKLDILAPAQKELWPEFKVIPRRFVLYGGTAIALRFGHRASVDFDFFSSEPFVVQQLLDELPFLRGSQLLQTAANTLTLRIERGGGWVKLSFFGGLSLGRISEPELSDDHTAWVASPLDLAATKVA